MTAVLGRMIMTLLSFWYSWLEMLTMMFYI